MTDAERYALAAARQRFRVGHVEGSGAQTFQAHALADVALLLGLVDHNNAQNFEDQITALEYARNEADDARVIQEERAERAEKRARTKIDEAIAKLREAIE